MRKLLLIFFLFAFSSGAEAQDVCKNKIIKSISAATDTQLVAAVSGKQILVCDWDISFSGSTNIYLEYSTTGTCASPTQLSQTWYGAANTGKTAASPFYRGMITPAGAQLCANTNTSTTVDITVYYSQQ